MHIKLSCAFIISTVLAGCGGAPNDTEIREAVSRELTLQSHPFMQMDIPAVLAKIKVLECRKAETSGYMCDIQGVEGQVNAMRFVKTDKGWAVVQR